MYKQSQFNVLYVKWIIDEISMYFVSCISSFISFQVDWVFSISFYDMTDYKLLTLDINEWESIPRAFCLSYNIENYNLMMRYLNFNRTMRRETHSMPFIYIILQYESITASFGFILWRIRSLISDEFENSLWIIDEIYHTET